MVKQVIAAQAHTIIFSIAIALGFIGAVIVLPYFSQAQGGGAGDGGLCATTESTCKANAAAAQKTPEQYGCPAKVNATVCPALKCEGLCVYGTMMCQGTGCSGNKKGDGDKVGEMPKMPELPKPPEKSPEQPKNDLNQDTCIVDPTSSSSPPKRINKYTGQPCEDTVNTAASSLFKDVFGSSSGESDSGVGGKLKDIASDILSSLGFTTDSSKEPAKKTSSDEATSTGKGGADFKEEVVEGKEGVTVRGSGYDAATKTGIAGFFGKLFSQRPISKGDTFLGRLCAARPWQSSFITRLFSPDFFDSLCKRRGYAIGGAAEQKTDAKTGATARATLACPANAPVGGDVKVVWDCFGSTSAGVGFDTKGRASGSITLKGSVTTTYALQCANGKHASCTTTVATPRAQIVVHPPRVPLNTRATVYWASEAVSECTVTGPGMKERGLKGAATTIPILDSAVFAIVCKTDSGIEVKATATVDVGP